MTIDTAVIDDRSLTPPELTVDHLGPDGVSTPQASIQPPQRPATMKLAPLPCGLVVFDHTSEMTNGTAYLPEVPAQRIRSANDLRNDVLWVSNVSAFDERVQRKPNLRSQFYFRQNLAQIAHDLGIQCSRDVQMAPDDAIKLSTIMTRSMTIAARAYGWDAAELGPLEVKEPFLLNDIGKKIPSPPSIDIRIRDELTRALTLAYQDESTPDWLSANYELGASWVTLRFNRVNYVKQLLECQMPRGRGWIRIEQVTNQEVMLQECLSKPSLVKATVDWDNASNDIAALAAFGHTGRKRSPMRTWISQPELAWISKYAKVTISSAWIDTSGYASLPPAVRLPALFTAHPEACLSYSAGLVALNHWQALASCNWSTKSRIEESNIWATWLRALDRAMMFTMALKAQEQGFHVSQYGSGSLQLKVSDDRLNDLAQFKEQHGFMYPDLTSLLQLGDEY